MLTKRQLDTDIINNIYLYHLSIDKRVNNGENLNNIVDDVSEIINDNKALSLFSLMLLETGYLNKHKNLYSANSYNIRKCRIYKISEDFPRIIEKQIPSGVGDVRYSVVISNDKWDISEENLFDKINLNVKNK